MMEYNIKSFVVQNEEQMLTTLKELCVIPAPSNYEHKRAEYCKKWLENIGAKGVYIDKALNVILPLNCQANNKITVFAAHTDTVFPDTNPMPCIDSKEKIYCPGCGDDTAGVAVLLMMAKYFVENNISSSKGIMFVCNSCEEGLGNLKGTRQLFENYSGRIERFISFDSVISRVNDCCVGSHRYEVEVKTAGGHSYGDFGNANAINELSKIITDIYKTEIPQKEGTQTTYNVGTIIGGTSVNSIAQNAKMLCEYRSNDKECLTLMQKKFETIFNAAKTDKVIVNVKKVGDRPCGNIEADKVEELKRIIVPIIEDITGIQVTYKSSSTDCNIPLSLGIPALCIGVCNYEGMHTREEWVEKASLAQGLEISINAAIALTTA